MKILMISPQFKPLVGGYERACERLAVALAATGNYVTVCAEQRDKSWPKQEKLNSVEIRRWWCLYKPKFHVITSLLGLAGFLLRNGRGFDVWHVHQYGMHAALAVAIGKMLRRPVAVKLTSTGSHGLSATLATARLGALQRWAHRRLSACVAVSEEAVAEAVAFGIPPSRVVEIPNGMDISTIAPVAPEERAFVRQALGLDPSRNVCLFLGRLAPPKNPLGLLQAWALLKPRLTQPWTLVIVGDGPLRDEVKRKVSALDLEADVLLAGESKQVPKWLAVADLFVLSSLTEGMANALLEAMACGLPSVVTQVSGMDQLVRLPQTGLVVPIDKPEALALALLSLHADPERRKQMGQRAREIIIRRFAIDKIAHEHLRMYERLLARGPHE